LDSTTIIGIIGLLLGTGGIAALLRIRHERDKLRADARKVEAEAEEIEGRNYRAVIEVLRAQYDALTARVAEQDARMSRLERRVADLETQNRGLRRRIAQFRVIVQELWELICDHNISVSCELGEAVADALEIDAA
jgi:predicted RNase H-like nuclease (RuvC/YqgF family)